MEKVINNTVTYYALFSIGLFVIVTMIYTSIGIDNDTFWWSLDKANDRIFTINLLFVTSFIFRDFVYRMFVYNAMLYIAIYGGYELAYINGYDINQQDFIWISLIYWGIALVLFLLFYVCKRNYE